MPGIFPLVMSIGSSWYHGPLFDKREMGGTRRVLRKNRELHSERAWQGHITQIKHLVGIVLVMNHVAGKGTFKTNQEPL